MPSNNSHAVSHFVDITIYRRLENNIFLNLTESELDDLSSTSALTYYNIEGISKEYNYAIAVFSSSGLTYITGATIDDIVALTGITNNAFIRQLQTGIDNQVAADMLASNCAKKIVDYRYGRCLQELRDNSGQVYYNFQRVTFKDGGKRKYVTCLTKAFRNTFIKSYEVNIWNLIKKEMKNNITVVR